MAQPQRGGFTWQKATASGGGGCIEVASIDAGVAVRDSKDPTGPILHYSLLEWDAFLEGVKGGEFDTVGRS